MDSFEHEYIGEYGNCTIKWSRFNGGSFIYMGQGANFVAQPDYKSELIIKNLMYSINDLKRKNEELREKLSRLS